MGSKLGHQRRSDPSISVMNLSAGGSKATGSWQSLLTEWEMMQWTAVAESAIFHLSTRVISQIQIKIWAALVFGGRGQILKGVSTLKNSAKKWRPSLRKNLWKTQRIRWLFLFCKYDAIVRYAKFRLLLLAVCSSLSSGFIKYLQLLQRFLPV